MCALIENSGSKLDLADFVANIVPIVIIKKYFEHHFFANQNGNDKINAMDKYYKIHDEALKNTKDEDNIQFGSRYKDVNKFIQSK